MAQPHDLIIQIGMNPCGLPVHNVFKRDVQVSVASLTQDELALLTNAVDNTRIFLEGKLNFTTNGTVTEES